MTLDPKKLEELRERDYDAYKVELAKPWPTMGQDMMLVFTIMQEYQKKSQGELRFTEDFKMDGEGGSVTLPEWIVAVRNSLVETYGESTGDVIFDKAICRLSNMIMKASRIESSDLN